MNVQTDRQRLSCGMVEGGGYTLSEPLGEKLFVIHVTFSSTTFTCGEQHGEDLEKHNNI